jgi:hypothetical protein
VQVSVKLTKKPVVTAPRPGSGAPPRPPHPSGQNSIEDPFAH